MVKYLTPEDFEIIRGEWPGRDWMRPKLYPIGHSLYADINDAKLMLYAQNYSRRRGCYVGDYWVDFRGGSLR